MTHNIIPEDYQEVADYLAFLLVSIGAINWGLVGLFDLNIVTEVLGTGTLTTVVYGLVGLAGLTDLLGVTGGYGLLASSE